MPAWLASRSVRCADVRPSGCVLKGRAWPLACAVRQPPADGDAAVFRFPENFSWSDSQRNGFTAWSLSIVEIFPRS